MTGVEVITTALLVCGCLVALVSGLGILRMPDFFTRIHPAGKNDTLAQSLILLGLMVAAGVSLVSVKLGFLWLFLFLTTPSSTHAIARAAHVDGRVPWQPEQPAQEPDA
jgi:multicomponent Na+:H+ antiporter subunit G